MALPNEPLTRAEQYLNRTATGGGTIPDEPLTRVEMYLNKIATGSGNTPDKPLTRMEMYLDEIAENGSGSDITLETLNVSQNGTTNAPDGVAYNKVTANVPNSYAAGDAGKVVSNGALVSQTNETVTQNRVVDTTTIKQVTVNVPNTYTASDNGKVVSGGALVSQTAHAEVTQNGTIDTTLNNSVVVNVPMKETLSWHQCPEAVRNYLAAAQAAYPSDENVTVINQYAPSRGNEVVANTKPAGYTIDGVTFRENEPLVATPFATSNKAGTLTALDRLRWYNTTPTTPAAGSEYPRGVNCRDLGGWSCDGGAARYGILIRGSEPNPADKELMVDKIGIKTEVQLLPVSEQGTDYKMKSPWGIDWAGNDTNETFYGLDKPYLWKKVLDAIMDSVLHSKPVYFHCGIGADRTGVVAMCLEAILGVSRADVDMDFELTNFAFGWQSLDGGIYRSRVYTTYKSLMTAVNAVPLANGLTDTFRNHWVSFVLSCGISIDKINAFRVACIDGNPETIIVTVPTYTITKSGSHVTYDNQIAEVQENGSYSVGISPDSGYEIQSVTVTMGGADVSQYYSNGTVSIPAVTGNVVITVTAVEVKRENLFDVSGAHLNSRIANVGDIRTGVNGRFICNMIDITNLSALDIEGVTQVADPDGVYLRIGLYTNATLAAASFVSASNIMSATYTINVASLKTANPTATHIAIQMCLGTAAVTAADLANLAIYGS